MKLHDIVMVATQDTTIRVILNMYGTEFYTERCTEYFLDCKETDALLDREVTDIRVVDKLLEVTVQ